MPSEEQILAKISELKEAGYSYKEIGKQVDLSPMAVRSRWRRMTGTHLKGTRSAKEAATKPGMPKNLITIAPERINEPVGPVGPISEANSHAGWTRTPKTERHVLAHIPQGSDKVASVSYSICNVPASMLDKIEPHAEYLYFDFPGVIV